MTEFNRQLATRTVRGSVNVLGEATDTASVSMNANMAYRKGQYFRAELAVDNSGGAVRLGITNVAVLPVCSGQYLVSNIKGGVFVPGTPEAFTYDADGHLTSEGRWNYTWDAENRLVRVMSYGAPDQASWRRVDWAYDALGRRTRQTSYVLSNGVWVVTEDLKFVSDPMLFGRHIAELNATNHAVVRSYVWGLDLSETLDGAGGVGGLLWVRMASGPASGTHFATYDGNGNVWQLVSASTGTATARYEYGPFGEPLRTTGPAAPSNPFRFSTKRTDPATVLVLYEYRAYSPSLGQWVGRDPINEIGSKPLKRNLHHFNPDEPKNLYGFVRNNALKHADSLGESATASVLSWIGTDCAVPEPSDPVWVKWIAYGILPCVAVTIDACRPVTCPLIKEMEQDAIGDPNDLDGNYKPPMKICFYDCPKLGVIRHYYPPGTTCPKSIIESKV